MTLTASPDLIDVNALAPDGIEPVEAQRCWLFENGKLSSMNGTVWTPMKPHVAECQAGRGERSWVVVRGGISREEAQEQATQINQMQAQQFSWMPGSRWAVPSFPSRCPMPFSADLPPGYGYQLETKKHGAPDENCTCGIYAATNDDQLPKNGIVYGKAKLWGKIVPGERGVRAQYAYPSEFHVTPDLADHPGLKAFGVPIIVKEATVLAPLQMAASIFPSPQNTARRWMYMAIAANLAACALNLILAASH